MLKSKFVRPYDINNRTVFSRRLKAGVYLIKEGTEIKYIGHSFHDVYKTLYRHFQSWEDSKQVRVTYNRGNEEIKVRVIYTNTREQAPRLEKALILKHNPKDNPEKYKDYKLDQHDKNILHEEEKTEPSLDGFTEVIFKDENDIIPF